MTHEFTAAERPSVLGAPYLPPIADALRVRYAVVGLTLAATSTFANGLTAANLQLIAGAYGVDAVDSAWLVAAILGMGAAANIFMIKGRQHFALEPLLFGALALYIAGAAAEAAFPSFQTALAARALNGLATSTIVATGVYYLMQALTGHARPLAVPLSIGFAQLGTPLARLVPTDLIAAGGSSLHLLVLGVALFQFLLVWSLRLPPTYTGKVMEPLDAVAAILLVPAIIVIAFVFAAGRARWWTDTPWLGGMAAAAVALATIAVVIESGRDRPIVDVAWLTRRDIGVFMLIALVERMALSEQTSGSIGLLTVAGLNNDQFHHLYAWVVAAMVAGIAVMVVTTRIQTIPFQVLAALGAIMAGALIDTGANALSRPDQMIVSQSLIGFGTTLFVGPALLYFVGRFLLRGPEAYVPTILLFGAIQNLGSAAGSALLGTVQYVGQQHALAGFMAQVRLSNTDPNFAKEGVALLANAYRQAAVIGFLDGIWVVVLLAAAAMALVAAALAVALVKARLATAGEKS